MTEVQFIQRVREKASEYRPVVLSQQEIEILLPFMRGMKKTMFQMIYGSGLRHRECRTLRIKDVCFDTGQIVVRNGKGQKDRVTVLPQALMKPLRRCIDEARAVHREDLQDGYGRVYLPYALHRKYPNADREIGWQYACSSSNSENVTAAVLDHDRLDEHDGGLLCRFGLRSLGWQSRRLPTWMGMSLSARAACQVSGSRGVMPVFAGAMREATGGWRHVWLRGVGRVRQASLSRGGRIGRGR